MGAHTNGVHAGVEQDDLVIPLIDFGAFVHGNPETRKTTAEQISHAFQTSGFLYLSNHGISKSQVSKAYSQSASFFKRPQSQKDSLAWTTPEANRGYVASGREKVTDSADPDEIAKLRASNPDLKESMEIGREGIPGQPNQWPDSFDAEGADFKTDMNSFFRTLQVLHMEVMRAIALGMNVADEHYFDSYVDEGDNTLRLLHYPAVKKSVFIDNPDQVRAGAHSDYGSITLLFQDEIGGLEVLSPKGTWVRATPIPDTIVVNAGDLLSRWSNNMIISTKHRVVQPPPADKKAVEDLDDDEDVVKARYSIAYFCNPNPGAWIEALPGTYEETGKKYGGINSGEYLIMRLAATY